MTARRTPEKVVQQQIVTFIKTIGGKVKVVGTRRPREDRHHSTFQTPGIPDLIVFVPLPAEPYSGRVRNLHGYIEVKAEGGRLRPEQREFQQDCAEAGVEHVVGDLDAVVAWLMRHGVIKPDQVAHYRVPPEFRDGQLRD